MGGGELARYAYTYTPSKQIATWQATQAGLPGREWSIAYDERQQVRAITEQPLSGPPASPQKVWRYQYDPSGNRVAAQENNQTRTTSYNNLNQMTGITHGGTTWLRGHVDEPANVTVNGQNARVYEDGTFEALTNVGPGDQTINVQATDTNGNTTTQNWQVNNGPASGAVPTHDIEGNLLTDGTYTYTWDARNRMTSVTKGSDTWSFAYDGQNRRISESKNGSLVRQFIWNGTRVMEERIEPQMSGQGLLTRRYWTGGVEMTEAGIDPQANFYLHDHLGSLRVVVGDDGTNQIAAIASYDYSPWGQRTENLTHRTDQHHSPGYTGHWWHVSGLSLAVYRPYDPATGRWPSRDPIEEEGGLNLYKMVENNPLAVVDWLGLRGIYPGWFPFGNDGPDRPTCKQDTKHPDNDKCLEHGPWYERRIGLTVYQIRNCIKLKCYCHCKCSDDKCRCKNRLCPNHGTKFGPLIALGLPGPTPLVAASCKEKCNQLAETLECPLGKP